MFVSLKWDKINKNVLRDAIINTAKNRDAMEYIDNADRYLELISADENLKVLWNNYQRNYEYASNILFDDTVDAIKTINDVIISVIS